MRLRSDHRAAARGDPAAADPTPARALPPLHHRHLPPRNLLRGDHLHSPPTARADDATQRRPCPLEPHAGAHDALPYVAKRPARGLTIAPRVSSRQPPRAPRVAERKRGGCFAALLRFVPSTSELDSWRHSSNPSRSGHFRDDVADTAPRTQIEQRGRDCCGSIQATWATRAPVQRSQPRRTGTRGSDRDSVTAVLPVGAIG
jgi:hypothetical protein